jgi:methyl-accepting chemotaxis protein
MPLKYKLILPAILSVFFSLGGFFLYLEAELSRLQQNQVRLDAQSLQQNVLNTLDLITRYNLEKAVVFVDQEAVLSAYRQALTGNIDDPNDPTVQQAREQLRVWSRSIITGSEKHLGTSEYFLHFHLPNNRSFLRVWRKNQTLDGRDLSDDLSGFRQTVVDVNAGRYPRVTGMELGRGGMVVRGIVPIFDSNNQRLGTLEVYSVFNQVIEVLQAEGRDFAVYLNREFVNIAKRIEANPEKHPPVGENFVFVSASNDALRSNVPEELLEQGKTGLAGPLVQGQRALFAFPISDYQQQQRAVMLVSRDISEFQSNISDMESGMLLAIAVMIVLLIVVLATVAYSLTSPINELSQVMEQLARGNIRVNIPGLRRKDEVGQMAQAVEFFKGRISEQQQIHEMLSTTGAEVVHGSHNLSTNLGDSTRNLDTISSNASSQRQGIEEVFTLIDQTSSSMQEIDTNAEQIREEAKQAREMVERSATEVNEMLQAANANLERSHKIQDIMNVISDIAQQTKMLAINAAIEAASAGEHGRGFSVVADDVSKLANDTTQAIQEIGRITQEALTEAKNTQVMATQVTENIQHVHTVSANTESHLIAITNSISENRAAMNHIADSFRQVETSARSNAEASQDLSRTMTDLARFASQNAQQLSEAMERLRAASH